MDYGNKTSIKNHQRYHALSVGRKDLWKARQNRIWKEVF